MKNRYINEKIFGLPKPLRKGGNTSPTSKRTDKEYVHKWVDKKRNPDFIRYRCLIKRQDTYKCKYFKTLKEAKLFVEMLRQNKYL